MTSVFLTVRDKSVYRHIQDPDISVRRGSTVLDSRTKKVETSATLACVTLKKIYLHTRSCDVTRTQLVAAGSVNQCYFRHDKDLLLGLKRV